MSTAQHPGVKKNPWTGIKLKEAQYKKETNPTPNTFKWKSEDDPTPFKEIYTQKLPYLGPKESKNPIPLPVKHRPWYPVYSNLNVWKYWKGKPELISPDCKIGRTTRCTIQWGYLKGETKVQIIATPCAHRSKWADKVWCGGKNVRFKAMGMSPPASIARWYEKHDPEDLFKSIFGEYDNKLTGCKAPGWESRCKPQVQWGTGYPELTMGPCNFRRRKN